MTTPKYTKESFKKFLDDLHDINVATTQAKEAFSIQMKVLTLTLFITLLGFAAYTNQSALLVVAVVFCLLMYVLDTQALTISNRVNDYAKMVELFRLEIDLMDQSERDEALQKILEGPKKPKKRKKIELLFKPRAFDQLWYLTPVGIAALVWLVMKKIL